MSKKFELSDEAINNLEESIDLMRDNGVKYDFGLNLFKKAMVLLDEAIDSLYEEHDNLNEDEATDRYETREKIMKFKESVTKTNEYRIWQRLAKRGSK